MILTLEMLCYRCIFSLHLYLLSYVYYSLIQVTHINTKPWSHNFIFLTYSQCRVSVEYSNFTNNPTTIKTSLNEDSYNVYNKLRMLL